MTRAAATAYAISLAREHLGDYVPTANVTLTTSREHADHAVESTRLERVWSGRAA